MAKSRYKPGDRVRVLAGSSTPDLAFNESMRKMIGEEHSVDRLSSCGQVVLDAPGPKWAWHDQWLEPCSSSCLLLLC